MRFGHMLLMAVLLSFGPAEAADTNELCHMVTFPRGQTAHVVVKPNNELERRMLGRLTTYLEGVLGEPATIVPSLDVIRNGTPAIILSNAKVGSPIPLDLPKDSRESFALVTERIGGRPGRSVVVAAGNSDRGLKRAIQRLIINSRQRPDGLEIPKLHISQSPWIPHREWTMCPWDPEFVRGRFRHGHTDKRLNIYLYSDRRLADYVEMLDWFGFSGCQLMETCYTYSVLGSVEAAHQWQKRIAGLLRANGQEVSLWAWTAEFSGYGWFDPEVTYVPKQGQTAYEDADVRRGFEKYYDYYAELAPYVDRFFGHFYDPGHLKNRDDVFKYMRLLESKLKARNPNIQMGIDCWAGGPDYLMQLVDNGFKDYLLLTLSLPEAYPKDSREKLHAEAGKLGLRLGIWGWYTTEYETDQLASMYVNGKVLKDVYTEIKRWSLAVHPVEYWSEMEAHHLNNIYSMYVASQLLWDPDRNPSEILAELTNGIWGPTNGPVILRALELIEEVRSGPTWETYWWRRPGHRVGTADPADDLGRAVESLRALTTMKTDAKYVPKFPLPYKPEILVELMFPHLKQIKLYADFRLRVADIRKAAAEGASKERLNKMLAEAWQPVPEYNTWIGTFGCKELREQKKTVDELRSEYQLTVKDPGWLRKMEADRVLHKVRNQQGMMSEPLFFTPRQINGEFYWPKSMVLDRLEKLVSDGVVEKVGENKYRLADWQNFSRE
ncbi:MAG: beta-N-acetylhexosaminidase family protein [Planctomycetota bacterium]|jgi:hypothetical protein